MKQFEISKLSISKVQENLLSIRKLFTVNEFIVGKSQLRIPFHYYRKNSSDSQINPLMDCMAIEQESLRSEGSDDVVSKLILSEKLST